MLNLKIIESVIDVKYSDDESYKIRFTTSDEWRLEAGRQNILPAELFTASEKEEMPGNTKKEFDLFSELATAALNAEMIVNIACKAVQSWTGVKDINGDDLPCTAENKRVVFKAFASRSKFIYIRTLDESLFSASLEDDLKN